MSTPTTPDYRIKFPAPTIDFTDDVGTTGQDHDNYPSPGTQARYDWMRLMLIGLLTHQASYEEPTQYRDGTVWYDLETLELKIWQSGDGGSSGAWTKLSDVIMVGLAGTTPVSLTNFYEQFQVLVQRVNALESQA
jgi:hypothetical protein